MSALPFLKFRNDTLLSYFVDCENGIISNAKKRLGTVSTHGYEMVSLRLNNKSCPFLTHRLIWEHCNGDIPEGLCVDHIDGNKLNNRISNLQLLSRSANTKKAYTDGKREGKRQNAISVIAESLETHEKSEFASINQASKQLGIHPFCIQLVMRGLTKSSGGYHFLQKQKS